eukprot:jgi/Botrbrau1/9296/Bobra.0111s0021.1
MCSNYVYKGIGNVGKSGKTPFYQVLLKRPHASYRYPSFGVFYSLEHQISWFGFDGCFLHYLWISQVRGLEDFQ